MLDIIKIAALLTGITVPSVDGGVASYYTYQDYGDGALYAHPSARYDPHNGIPWCAINVQAYLSGGVLPGDKIIVKFVDSDKFLFLEAWDAGPFDDYLIEDFPNLPILVDIPQHLWPLHSLSAEIEMINLSKMERMN